MNILIDINNFLTADQNVTCNKGVLDVPLLHIFACHVESLRPFLTVT